MDEKKLRSELIKLAANNPDLRDQLLPLLRKEWDSIEDLHSSFHAVDNVLAIAKKYSSDAAYVLYSDDFDSLFQGTRGQKTLDGMDGYLDSLSKLNKVLQELVTAWDRVKAIRYRKSIT